MKGIRLYVEGAKDVPAAKRLRGGISDFLAELRDEARRRGVEWTVIACGHREDAFRDFRNGQARHADAFNVLLVDSESSVQGSPREHLSRADRWVIDEAADEQVHLMAQAMEAWFIADVETLAAFYGEGFAAKALPGARDVETIPKDDLVLALKRATRGTQKGEYHKTRHAFDILARLDASKVRSRAPHCERLFETIHRHLTS